MENVTGLDPQLFRIDAIHLCGDGIAGRKDGARRRLTRRRAAWYWHAITRMPA